MWTRPEHSVLIHPSQLVIGLFVDIELPWSDHPFLYSKFRITSAEQIAEIQALGLPKIKFFPNRSTTGPGLIAETPPVASAPAVTPQVPHRDTFQEEKKAKLQAQKDSARRAERGWENAAKQTREALAGLSQNPRMAGQLLAKLSTETAEKVSSGGEILIHLLGDKKGEGPQFHALNVMTLSMILGKSLKLTEGELSDLALGALAHDVGKARIPPHLLKAKTRAKHEEDFYRAHVQYGLELAREAGMFSVGSLAIIGEHHEFLNGSGFPRGNRKPSPMAQIVGLVNRYDRLCGPESPDKPSLMPAEALAVLFAREADKFDEKLLGLLIKSLGVYPPGTIIMLNDGSLGLVVSPGRQSLRPEILIYDPDVDKTDAIVIDMSDTPDLKIEESIRPANLPSDVLFWLNPRQRLSYFFSMESATD
jgi:HD-GYP domain-containing protein (c-di-GMP phosphodiesterase class II)